MCEDSDYVVDTDPGKHGVEKAVTDVGQAVPGAGPVYPHVSVRQHINDWSCNLADDFVYIGLEQVLGLAALHLFNHVLHDVLVNIIELVRGKDADHFGDPESLLRLLLLLQHRPLQGSDSFKLSFLLSEGPVELLFLLEKVYLADYDF